MRAAAEILKGRRVHERALHNNPGYARIWLQCAREGLFDIFAEAGCVVSTPTCGPCLGGYMGIFG